MVLPSGSLSDSPPSGGPGSSQPAEATGALSPQPLGLLAVLSAPSPRAASTHAGAGAATGDWNPSPDLNGQPLQPLQPLSSLAARLEPSAGSGLGLTRSAGENESSLGPMGPGFNPDGHSFVIGSLDEGMNRLLTSLRSWMSDPDPVGAALLGRKALF